MTTKTQTRAWRTLKETACLTGYKVRTLEKMLADKELKTLQRKRFCEHRIPLSEVRRLGGSV